MNVIIFILADIEDKHCYSDIDQITIVISFENDINGAIRTYKSVLNQREIGANIILSVNGDESEQIARKLQSKVDNCTKVISSRKKGKAHAINNALNYVETEWFGVIDADCEFKDRDSFRILCNGITDRTIAIGGRLKARKNWSPITWIQNMEYKRTFLHRHQVSRDLGCVTLISGAFGIFKKDIVLSAGGTAKILSERAWILFSEYKDIVIESI